MEWNKKHIILSLLLPLQILLIQYGTYNSNFIENFYSRGIYPYLSSFLRIAFGWIPYSIGDIVLCILVLWILFLLINVVRLKFKNAISSLLKLVAVLSIIHFCFYFFWGLNYYRIPLEENLSYESKKYTDEELIKTTKFIAKQLNQIHTKITKNDTVKIESPYSQKDIYKMSSKGFEELEKDFPLFSYKFPSIKSSSMSLLQSYNGTSGYLNPLTGEAHVNSKIPRTGYPTTTCHEIAHQIGFAAENEANFIGFLAANYHTDVYFKYASYRMAFSYCISEVRKRNSENSKKIWKTINKGIIKDYNKSYAFWQSYKNPLEPYIKKGYNAYLKANNQKKGIQSYNYVVDLLIIYFNQNQKFSTT